MSVMTFDELFNYLNYFWHLKLITINNNPITVSNLVLGAVFLYVAVRFATKLSQVIGAKVFPRVFEDEPSRRTVQNFTYYLLIFFFSLFALNLANIPLTVFTFLGGALAIGAGFGSQNLVNNFFSGLVMMVERPVKVGDFIEVDSIFGRIQDIGFRSTKMISIGNRHMIVPNSIFLEKNVLNWTFADNIVRVSIDVGVVYGSYTKLVKELLYEAVGEDPQTLKYPKPNVQFTGFGDNSLNFKVYFSMLLRDLMDMEDVKSDIRFKIDEKFRSKNVVIAFPQRDVHLDTAKPLEVKITRDL